MPLHPLFRWHRSPLMREARLLSMSPETPDQERTEAKPDLERKDQNPDGINPETQNQPSKSPKEIFNEIVQKGVKNAELLVKELGQAMDKGLKEIATQISTRLNRPQDHPSVQNC